MHEQYIISELDMLILMAKNVELMRLMLDIIKKESYNKDKANCTK